MPVSNCIGFVLGLPLLVINREACHADRAYAMRHLFMACRVRCILPQFLTLLLFSFILFVVFLLCTFCTDRKYQRARHTGKIFTNVLCSGHIMWAFGRSSVRHSRLSVVFRVLRNSLHADIWNNIYPHYAQTASHNGLKTTGLALDFSTVPSLGYYLCWWKIRKREPCHVDRAYATRHLIIACRGATHTRNPRSVSCRQSVCDESSVRQCLLNKHCQRISKTMYEICTSWRITYQ